MGTRIEHPERWFTEVLPARVEQDPAATGGFEGAFCVHLEGSPAASWTCHIGPGTARVEPGLTDQAAFTMSMGGDHFVKLVNGELNARSAYATGRLKVAGDLGQAMRVFRLFVS
jgi:putative sterol carrier protein